MFPWQPVFLSSWFSAGRWICWEIFSLLGHMKMLGLGQKKKKKTEINPHQPIRGTWRLFLSQTKIILGIIQPNSQWVLQNTPKKPKLCWKNLIFLSLFHWDDLYRLSWNSRRWKNWGKKSQILNAMNLSRPKRIFISGKIIYIRQISKPFITWHCWLAWCILEQFLKLFRSLMNCNFIFFFSLEMSYLVEFLKKPGKIEKKIEFSDFSIIGLVGGNWYLWIVLARWDGAGERNADFMMERTLKL